MVRLRSAFERFRESLLFLPLVLVVAAGALAQGMVWLDGRVESSSVPGFTRATVDNARSLLSTIAGATITVVAVVFSLTLVAVQLASTQYSPRSVQSFMRDRFQQWVLGLTLGTVTYCLLVLRVVRSPLHQTGDAVVPSLSVSIAVVLAIASIAAILASIDRTARSMQANELIRRVTDDTLRLVRRELDRVEPGDAAAGGSATVAPSPDVERAPLPSPRTGWVRQLDLTVLARALPEGSVVRIEAPVGVFVVEGQPLCTVAPPPEDPGAVATVAHRAFEIGRSRTLTQDVPYGVTQLVDIALRALSPGVNDPTTAREVVVHLGAVLVELLHRELPAPMSEVERRRIERPERYGHEQYVRIALGPIRRAGAAQPEVVETLLRTMAVLRATAAAMPRPAVVHEIEALAAEMLERLDADGLPAADVERCHALAERLDLAPDRRSPG